MINARISISGGLENLTDVGKTLAGARVEKEKTKKAHVKFSFFVSVRMIWKVSVRNEGCFTSRCCAKQSDEFRPESDNKNSSSTSTETLNLWSLNKRKRSRRRKQGEF